MLSRRRILYRLRRLLRRLGKSSGSPHEIALGMGIGFLIGWMPFFGMQMALSVLLCHLLRANKVVPLLPVWLTNPVTFVPVMASNYWVGWKLVGGPPPSEIVSALKKLVVVPGGSEGWLRNWWEGTRHGIGELLLMGWDMVLPIWLGSFIVGLALAAASYYLTRRFVESFRAAMRRKKRRNRERRRQKHLNPAVALAGEGLGAGGLGDDGFAAAGLGEHAAGRRPDILPPMNAPRGDAAAKGAGIRLDDGIMMDCAGRRTPFQSRSTRQRRKVV